MFHAAEGLCNLNNIAVLASPLHNCSRHHNIGNIVRAWDTDAVCGHKFTGYAVLRDANHTVFQIYAVFGHALLGAAPDHALRVQRQFLRDRIVQIDDQAAARFLMGINRGFCLHILREILVIIQMVRRQVGDGCDRWAKLHAHKLKAG